MCERTKALLRHLCAHQAIELNTQAYRSGHNEAVLKTVRPKATGVRIPQPAPKNKGHSVWVSFVFSLAQAEALEPTLRANSRGEGVRTFHSKFDKLACQTQSVNVFAIGENPECPPNRTLRVGVLYFLLSQRLSNPLSERTREERGSHIPLEVRQARLSVAECEYIRHRRKPRMRAKENAVTPFGATAFFCADETFIKNVYMKASKGEKRVSAILLWYDVAAPQLFYNVFHKLHLLLA